MLAASEAGGRQNCFLPLRARFLETSLPQSANLQVRSFLPSAWDGGGDPTTATYLLVGRHPGAPGPTMA